MVRRVSKEIIRTGSNHHTKSRGESPWGSGYSGERLCCSDKCGILGAKDKMYSVWSEDAEWQGRGVRWDQREEQRHQIMLNFIIQTKQFWFGLKVVGNHGWVLSREWFRLLDALKDHSGCCVNRKWDAQGCYCGVREKELNDSALNKGLL